MSIITAALASPTGTGNSMAFSIPAKLFELRNPEMQKRFELFDNVEHKMERVNVAGNICFINDAISETVNGVWYALQSINTPIIWITGGFPIPHPNAADLIELVRQKTKAIVCLGSSCQLQMGVFFKKNGKHFPVMVSAQNMQSAVKTAKRIGYNGDTVLLSSGTNMTNGLFQNYADCGEQFKSEIFNQS